MIFSMRNRFRRPRGDPPRRGHKCALRPPNAAICYESATFANWKTRAQKSDKNEKTFSKKWNLHPSAAIRAPSSASLKKGCLEHSKNAGFYKVSTTLQRETRCAWICSKLLRFCKVFLMKKKSKKVKSNKTYVFYWSGWRNVSQNHSFYRKWFWATKSQQQKTHPASQWFCVCVVTMDT